MTRPLAALIAVAFFLLAHANAHAQDPVVVDLRIEQSGEVTVGDRIGYTIVVEVDAGTGIALAAAELPPQVALVDAPQEERVPLDNGREQVTMRFQMAPFVPGEIEMPPLGLRFTNPDGTSGTVQAFASAISVASVLPASGQVTPRDLKPQAEIGTPPATWPVPVIAGVVAGVVLLIVASLVRGRWVKYRTTRALRRVPVYAGPEDAARAALDRAAADFQATGDYVALYTALGNVVRIYLTQRYEFPAFALTTRELEAEMMQMGLDRWQVRVAGGLLAQCDAVIYARYRPAGERADADLTAAYEIVEMSRPEERMLEEREKVAVG